MIKSFLLSKLSKNYANRFSSIFSEKNCKYHDLKKKKKRKGTDFTDSAPLFDTN